MKRPQITRRTAPQQERGARTVEEILEAAARLLEEVGFEQMSTNLICKRAGLTPPALYRYFSSKHAVVAVLGERLMDRQNEALGRWAAGEVVDEAGLPASVRALLKETLHITWDFPSGVWVMRCLRASPTLNEVRLKSHRHVASFVTDWLCSTRRRLNRERVYGKVRLGVELGYSAIEMVFDEPAIDLDLVLDEAAKALAGQLIDALIDTPASS